METGDLTSFLKNTEIFARTNIKTLEEVASVMTPLQCRKNQVIIKKGEKGNAMYIISSGKVRVHDGNHVLSRLSPGHCFGEYSLFDEETRSASVTTEEETKLFRLSQDDLFNLISKDMEITKGILRVLIKQMRDRNTLEEKLSKSYLKIQKQKEEIEAQHKNTLEYKKQLEQQNYDLISLNDEKNQLLSIVVHGLKNPLTSSLCLAEMLHTGQEQEGRYSEYSGIICKSLHRMNNMINQMLNINSIDSKKFRLQLERINLASVIKDVIKNFNIIASQKNIECALKLDNLHVMLNRVYIIQVIDNLVSNAVKFSPRDSIINVALLKNGGNARFEIKDNGPGIPEAKQKNLFNQYERQSPKQTDSEDHKGLGLVIVKKYAEAMNGKVWFESPKGKGTTFYAEFLLAPTDCNQE